MTQVTKAQLLSLSEKIEGTYLNMEDELLVLIASYIARGENEFTIAQMMRWNEPITREAMKIIAKYAGLSLAEVEDIMNEAMEIALEDIEGQLQEAAKDGHIQEAPPLKDSERVRNVIDSATNQSKQKLRQMNNTILGSVIVEYQEAVNQVINEKRRLEQQTYDREIKYDPEDLDYPYYEAVQEITKDREITAKAIEKAIDRLADEGITGFIDSAGRSWHADTYAAMVIRTNAHNVAIDATRARQQDYASDLFQISAHGGARELCYPYQGKICSWTSATGGSFIDGAGVKWEYLSLENDTSYGEAAGIFGINCGHHPMPIIPGVSVVHELEIQSKEENDREYAESQKQRYLERQIREAKRQYEMQKAAGADAETLKRYKQNVENKQKDMREFIDDTGRTRRYDREKIQQQNSSMLYSGDWEIPSFMTENYAKTASAKKVEKYYNEINMQTNSETIINVIKRDIAKMPERDLEYLLEKKLTVYKSEKEASFFKQKGNEIHLVDSEKSSFIHEYAHFVAMNRKLYEKPEFKAITENVIREITKLTTYTRKNMTFVAVESPRLITGYQGRTYISVDDWNRAPEEERVLEASDLLEYVTIGYQVFINNPGLLEEKDADLYAYFMNNGLTGEK